MNIIRINPSNYIGYMIKGAYYYIFQSYQQALEAIKKGTELNPDHVAYLNMGLCYMKMENLNESIKCYDKAIKVKPDCAEAYCNKGSCLNKRGNVNEAIQNYDKAIQLKPGYFAALSNKASLLTNLGKHNEAICCYDKATQSDPTNHLIYYFKSITFIQMNKINECLKSIDKAIKLLPSNGEYYKHKIKILEAFEKNDEAKNCYKDALKVSKCIFDEWPDMKKKYENETKTSLNCNNCQKENPKYKCSACKTVDYCSVECQKQHWSSTHKTVCPYSNRVVQTVIVDGMKAVNESVPVSVLKAYEWIKCEVPGMIGMPLMVRRCGYQPIRPNKEVAIFLMVDPQTGLADADWQQRVGIVQFVCSDFKDFSADLFWDIYSYIFTLMDCYGEPDFNYKQFEKKYLNNKSFKNYQEQEHEIQRQYQKNLEANRKICSELKL